MSHNFREHIIDERYLVLGVLQFQTRRCLGDTALVNSDFIWIQRDQGTENNEHSLPIKLIQTTLPNGKALGLLTNGSNCCEFESWLQFTILRKERFIFNLQFLKSSCQTLNLTMCVMQ